VIGGLGDTWLCIDAALKAGMRGLNGKIGLAQLLAEKRGVRNPKRLQKLTIKQILRWADRHRRRTGAWPHSTSGPIPGTMQETWRKINYALTRGIRGLPEKSSLARLLAEQRGARNHLNLPRLTIATILRWADEHHRQTGNWPKAQTSGRVLSAPWEAWKGLNAAVQSGYRGLTGGITLAQLLVCERGVPHLKAWPHIRERQIIDWAKVHHRRTGEWPRARTGPIADAPGLTWKAIDESFRAGCHGLPSGTTLLRFLIKHVGARPTEVHRY
jgi:hypothetical protein